ncbi:hypothetical protein [Petroclostridium sp. X23]|uniref:hypothetical protein n=1 Tax=Petroclostridium sp. X23 TaxID=3045146 RepID=UPI0024AE3011|nr:hypothetical protein [Petroclostridium sp. X23]WHH60419.1 hypothetical protein QKW49_06755 [Petroclostridium sp. X23]
MSRRVLMKEAAKVTGLSEWELRTGAKAGRYPHMKVGNRYIFDLDILEAHIKRMIEDSINPQESQENISQYGKLRKING